MHAHQEYRRARELYDQAAYGGNIAAAQYELAMIHRKVRMSMLFLSFSH